MECPVIICKRADPKWSPPTHPSPAIMAPRHLRDVFPCAQSSFCKRQIQSETQPSPAIMARHHLRDAFPCNVAALWELIDASQPASTFVSLVFFFFFYNFLNFKKKINKFNNFLKVFFRLKSMAAIFWSFVSLCFFVFELSNFFQLQPLNMENHHPKPTHNTTSLDHPTLL